MLNSRQNHVNASPVRKQVTSILHKYVFLQENDSWEKAAYNPHLSLIFFQGAILNFNISWLKKVLIIYRIVW